MKHHLNALLVAILLVPLLACRKEADPVRAAIDSLAAAADDRDADAAGEVLAAAYTDAEHADRAAALQTIRRYFAAYERISTSFSDVQIDRKPDLARATFTATFDGAPRKIGSLDAMLPRSAKVRFEMNLVPEEGRWKVAWAGWQLVSEGTGP
ncbi:MAG: nuclear transport factor 2 family protein [Thermoanaerobaculia bacterium]|nr:nuclear transport factor 2 family protein [Thermoanaerobaculia bacterium]